MQEIAKNATTGGLYKPIGELYGFPVKVVSERTLKEGLEFTDNRFVVEGNYKYTYNNGHLAMADPVAAARNFLNAMEKIPSTIDQYKAKNEVLEKEVPQLQEIASKVWKKEDELKQLKSELAALDRKIQLELLLPQRKPPKRKRRVSNRPDRHWEMLRRYAVRLTGSILPVKTLQTGSLPYGRDFSPRMSPDERDKDVGPILASRSHCHAERDRLACRKSGKIREETMTKQKTDRPVGFSVSLCIFATGRHPDREYGH